MSDPIYNLSYTLAAKRSHLNWRAAIVANSVESLQDALAEKPQVTRVVAEPGLAYVFTGQGAQWARMGVELMHYPVFRKSIESADAYLKTLGCSWSLIGKSPLTLSMSTVAPLAKITVLITNLVGGRRNF